MEISSRDDTLLPFICRLIGDHDSNHVDSQFHGRAIVKAGLKSKNHRSVNEAIVAAARQNYTDLANVIAQYCLNDEDPVIAHTAFQALARLGAADACFDALMAEGTSKGASFALMRMHDAGVVDRLIQTVNSTDKPFARRNALSALCRLYHHEGEWTGDSWGTRPDTRGPYYQPEPWAETDKIDAFLKKALAEASPEEATFLVREMSRNRIQSNDALDRVLTLAKENPKMLPEAASQLATAETIPADALPILLDVLKREDSEHASVANAVTALSRTDSPEVVPVTLAAFVRMQDNIGQFQAAVQEAKDQPDPVKAKSDSKYARQALTDAQGQFEAARKAFLESGKLENHHQEIEKRAGNEPGAGETYWAKAALIALASRKGGSPESQEMSGQTLAALWKVPAHRTGLIKAAADTKNRFLDDRIRIAMNDPIKEVAQAAKSAAKALKIQAAGEDKTPKIATLDPKKAHAMVVSEKGDVALGEAVFARATCIACHTVSQDEPQKGPYLGNIAETYKRPELATAIIDPNASIAQGFKTNMITLKDGTVGMGFVTDEQGDKVTIRDVASQEHVYQKADITKRDELPTSMMPPGLMNQFTVHEMASLLDYLEVLAKKK